MMKSIKRFMSCLYSFLFPLPYLPSAMPAQNQVLGEVKLVGKTKATKTSAYDRRPVCSWYVMSLETPINSALPGEPEISVSPVGFQRSAQKDDRVPKKDDPPRG